MQHVISSPKPLAFESELRRGLESFFQSPTDGDKFYNPWPHTVRRGFKDIARWKLGKHPVRAKTSSLPAVPVFENSLDALAHSKKTCRLLWLGHATFHIELDDVGFIIDPVFGNLGGLVKRLTPLPLPVESLPRFQMVLLTHGHFGHTDSASLKTLCAHSTEEIVFVVPLGLTKVLPRCCKHVIELNWWERIAVKGVEVVLVPAQHWHRRGLRDLDRCLWGGYVLRGSSTVYHSGDTAFFGGFEAIARVFPKLDIACLPVGAYEPRWFMSGQHMAPEESLEAFKVLGAEHFVAMHWGVYNLSDEAVDAGPALLQQLSRNETTEIRDRLQLLQPGGVIGYERGTPIEKAGAMPGW